MGTDDNGYELAVCHKLGKAAKLRTGTRFSTNSPPVLGIPMPNDFEDDRNLGAVAVGEFGRVRLDPEAAIRAPHEQPHARRGRATKRHRRPRGKITCGGRGSPSASAARGRSPRLTSEAARR